MNALSPGPERPEEHLAHNLVLQSKLDGGEALPRDQLMKTLFLTTVLGEHLEETRTLNLKTDIPITHSMGKEYWGTSKSSSTQTVHLRKEIKLEDASEIP